MIRAKAADGSIHEFPDGTKPAVVDKVMRQYAQNSAAYQKGKRDAKSGKTRGLGGEYAITAAENLPFVDEVQAGLAAGGLTLMGGGGKGKGVVDRFKTNYGLSREYQRGVQDGFRERSPVLHGLTVGQGFALQAIPAMASGGSTVAAAPASENLFARGLEFAGNRVKDTVTGATATAANVFAGRGTLKERVRDANAAIVPGAAIGLFAPMVMGTPGWVARGPVGRTTARTVNKAVVKAGGKPLLDPRGEVVRRLNETLKADGLTPQQVQQALTEWQRVGGPSPAFMDLVAKNGGGQQTMALIRGSAMNGPGRTVANKYGNQVAADLQDNAIARTGQLVPNDRRTVPQVERELDTTIRSNSQAPDVQPGSGGAQVSQTLNQRYDAARGQTNAAYDAVRNAAPEQALLPRAEAVNIASGVRNAVQDFDPLNVPRVARELGNLENLETPNLRDYFRARTRLGALRVSADPVERNAAARAVQALDGELDRVITGNLVTGDTSVLAQARAANAARRTQGQQFESGDLIADLVGREYRGGGMTNTVAPEDASRRILGTGTGFGTRPNLTRDLTRLRDTLGPDSPEWNALRREALSRTLGVDAGSPNFGQAFIQLERSNPELAGMLMTPTERTALAANRANIVSAEADRQALDVGQRVLNAKPDEYASDLGSNMKLGSNLNLSQLGAARELEARIGAPTEGATGVLNRIATATNPGRNLRATFGADAANDYRQSIDQMVEQVNNARFINPNGNSQSAGRLFDTALVDEVPTTKIGALQWLVNKLRNGATLTDSEKELIVQLATSRMSAPENLSEMLLPTAVRGPRFSQGNLFAIPAAQENNR